MQRDKEGPKKSCATQTAGNKRAENHLEWLGTALAQVLEGTGLHHMVPFGGPIGTAPPIAFHDHVRSVPTIRCIMDTLFSTIDACCIYVERLCYCR